MRISKRLAALFIAASMTVTLLVSCSDKTGSETAVTTQSTGNTAVTESEETTKTVYTADVPDEKYDGYQFNVLVKDLSTIVWYDTDFSAEEADGETLNDAVYNRRVTVEEKLDISIEPVYATDANITQLVKKSVAGDDNAFDICFMAPQVADALIQGGNFLNLFDVPNLDLSAAWWDQNAVADLSVGGKLYLAAGDIGYNYKRSTSILFFNKQLISDNTLENPYELVNSGSWTLSKLFEMSKAVTSDADGSGAIEPATDKFGIAYCPDTIYQLMIAGGVSMAVKDENDLPTLSFMTDRTASIFADMTDFFYNPELTFEWESSGVNMSDRFTADMLLFLPTEFWVITTLRNMDTDFGVLPMPKYTEDQQNYGHAVNQTVAALMLIPKTNRDTARTGAIVSVLGAEGKNTLTPAYYELALKTKYSRDNESEAMFDIIFDSIKWDIGFMYDWGGIKSTLRTLVSAKNSDLASRYAKVEKSITKAMDKAVKAYSELD